MIEKSAETQIHLKAHLNATETSSVLSNYIVFLVNKSIYVYSKIPILFQLYINYSKIFQFFSRNFGYNIVAFKWTSNDSIISLWKKKAQSNSTFFLTAVFHQLSRLRLHLFVSQHGIVDLPSEAVLDVGEAGGGQEGSVLSGRPLPSLRLNQHVEGVELHGERA